ncbi:pentatricopeptide repeat-containing protein At2g27610 [Impatiens glandulifera]|uniref:pentatricopeptide repeat-containing protein At2g27610 n=1 Tax=Impatiens glandulifera TaxID=253017 RepID=UPI001FB09D4D|nr:pentatricopeptide repeat-containing protein At2g27610 [Impatiens glandulifera]
MTESVYIAMLRRCTSLTELASLRQLHCNILKTGLDSDLRSRISLMVSYRKCSEMDSALNFFNEVRHVQDVISWTAMISGYLQNGGREKAVNLFCLMNREGIRPNHFTYSAILTAHPIVSVFQVHAQVIRLNYEKAPAVGTALLDAYTKLRAAYEAKKVFEVIEVKDIVAWSAMVAAFAQVGDADGAAKVFVQMGKEGVRPNEFTFSSAINACASPSATNVLGKQFHSSSIKHGYSDSSCVSTSLVTMYAKRGNIESASEVFISRTDRDLVSWNSMISGYARHGYGEKAIEVFHEMLDKGLQMDNITFIGVITACAHAGLVEKGERYFEMMVEKASPTMEHYSCMVNLYSRAGMLDKALNVINGMPFAADATIWRILLAGCRNQLNLEMGKFAAKKLISLDPGDSAAYVLQSNMYAAAGKWEEKDGVRKMMDEKKVKKEAGYSWVEVNHRRYRFMAGDHSHPLSNSIYLKLEEICDRVKEAGYVADTSFVLHDVELQTKEVMLSQHSERLAIAFALLATPAGMCIQIAKNLRVCGDCHAFIKLISDIENREIVVRDTVRFHHFKDGVCSCGDYW